MKFSVEKALASGGRLGLITQAGRSGNITLETPMCMLFTKGGSAPHLSMDMLKKISSVPNIATMTLGSLANHHESVAEFGNGLGEFTAMKNKLIFTTLHDSSLAVPTGKNDKLGVAVWSKGGKIKLDTALFMKVQEAFQPDWFQAMSDGDTDRESGPKRLQKSVDRTLDFLDEIIDKKHGSEGNKDAPVILADSRDGLSSGVLSKSAIIGSVEGGFNEALRIISAKETASRPVHGFLIEGFEKGNSGKDLFGNDDFPEILSKTIKYLPDDKPRIMETVWSPLHVIKAFRLGIDVFSSAYPHTLTERGHALIADYTLPPNSHAARLEAQGLNSYPEDQHFYLDLNNKVHFEDFRPLSQQCTCYTCANFTRSYIHHLLNTSELLAYVLLTIHNFHQYFDFFHHLRKAVLEDKLNELEQSLVQQISAGDK